MIDVDRQRDVEAPKVKKHKLQVLGDHSSLRDTLDTLTPNELGHASMIEESTLGRSSSQFPPYQSAYRTLMVVTYSNKHQLKKLAQSLSSMRVAAAERAMENLVSSVDNLCKRVDVIEGAINTMKTDMIELKRKAHLDDGSDMAMLVEAIKAPKDTLEPIDALMQSMGISKGVAY